MFIIKHEQKREVWMKMGVVIATPMSHPNPLWSSLQCSSFLCVHKLSLSALNQVDWLYGQPL